MDPTSDLVRRCADGDPLAFDCLVREYMNTVLGLAYNYVGNFHTAEDLTQETFVQALQSISSLRDGSRFQSMAAAYREEQVHRLHPAQPRAGCRSITIRTCTGRFPSRQGRRLRTEEDDGSDFSEADLLTALDSLREDYREIFVMKHVDNLSYREISDLLGMTVSAVGEKLYRVRSMIREKLIENRSGSSAS